MEDKLLLALRSALNSQIRGGYDRTAVETTIETVIDNLVLESVIFPSTGERLKDAVFER
jgi:hypothetical protein